MSWDSLTNDEKLERLGNLEVGKTYSFRYKPNNTLYSGKYLGRTRDWNDKDAIRIQTDDAWRGMTEVLSLEDLDVDARPFVQPQRAREIQAEKDAREAAAAEEARARAPELALKAAKPGKSAGYIDSQLRERYNRDDRVIVLFSGDDPPIWYKGTILSVGAAGGAADKLYFVVFDDGDERWIQYKNKNIRYFGNAVEAGLEQKQQQRGRGRRKTRKKRRKTKRKTKKRRRKRKKRKTKKRRR